MNARRILEFVVVPALLVAGFVIPVLVWGDRLPDEIAVHWDLAGTPDRGDSVATSLWIMMSIFVTAWAAVAIFVLARKVGGTEARVLVGALYWLGAVLVAVWVLGLQTSLDVADWRDADRLSIGWLFASMVLAAPLAWLGWLLADGHPEVGSRGRGVPVTPMVSGDGALVWSGTAANPGLVAVAVAPLLATLLLVRLSGDAWPAVAVASLVAIVATSVAGRIRVTVGPKGLRVRMGWLGWPRRTIPVEDITDVTVEDVSPMRYGGWGFRLALGAQAWIVRAGPAIRVERGERSAFVVTVDDATTGAAVLAGHLEDAATRS